MKTIKKILALWPDIWVWPLVIGLFLFMYYWGFEFIPGFGAYAPDQLHAMIVCAMWFIVGTGLSFGAIRFNFLFLFKYYAKHNDKEDKASFNSPSIVNDFNNSKPWLRLVLIFCLLAFMLLVWVLIMRTVIA